MKIRAVMLTTALQPYTGIADLFVVDPDGYVIRKWNSKELNNGVLTGAFQLPEFPKVGEGKFIGFYVYKSMKVFKGSFKQRKP